MSELHGPAWLRVEAEVQPARRWAGRCCPRAWWTPCSPRPGPPGAVPCFSTGLQGMSADGPGAEDPGFDLASSGPEVQAWSSFFQELGFGVGGWWVPWTRCLMS